LDYSPFADPQTNKRQAIAALFALHDYPDTAKFLNAEEKHEVLRRLESDRSALADEFSMHLAAQALKDWKVYVHMLLNNGIYTSLYSISLFLPTIIKGLGYTNNSAQLHTVPVYLSPASAASPWDSSATRGKSAVSSS